MAPKTKTTPSKNSNLFEPGDLISLKVGPEHEENFRKYVLPQKHKLLKKLQAKDQACVLMKGLPFGMTKENLEKYMSQFGNVLRCNVPTSPKNGKIKGYAYIHYEHSQVAKIACSTMNNYLLLGSLLKCQLIPGSSIKESFFAKTDKNFHRKKNGAIAKINQERSSFKEKKLTRKRVKLALLTIEKNEASLTPEMLHLSKEPEVEVTPKKSVASKAAKDDTKQSGGAGKKTVSKSKTKKLKKTKISVASKMDVKKQTKKTDSAKAAAPESKTKELKKKTKISVASKMDVKKQTKKTASAKAPTNKKKMAKNPSPIRRSSP